MEGTRGNEKDMICFDGAVFGAYGCAFDQRKQVTLDALAGNIAATGILTGCDFVDLVEKDNSVLLNAFKRGFCDLFIIKQFVSFL